MEQKARTLSAIYGCFSVGTVIGLSVTPLLLCACGWAATFQLAALVGLIWAVCLLSENKRCY